MKKYIYQFTYCVNPIEVSDVQKIVTMQSTVTCFEEHPLWGHVTDKHILGKEGAEYLEGDHTYWTTNLR